MRAVLPLVDALHARGIPVEPMLRELHVARATDLAPDARVAWDDFARFCDRFRAAVGDDDTIAAMGENFVRWPAWRPIRAIARTLAHPAAVYRLTNELLGPSLFRVPRGTMDKEPDGTLRMIVEIPPEYRDNPTFFWITLGAMRAAPRVVGSPPADVRMTLSPRRAIYAIRLGAYVAPGVVGRARNTLARAFALPSAIEEFDRQRAELLVSYEALQRALRRIRRQEERLRGLERRQRETEEARRLAEQQFLLAQKLEGLGLLAGGVAHDVNNLLASILGNAEMLLDELPADAPERARVERIVRAVDRAGDLTGQLLAYAGRRPSDGAAVDVSALVQEMGDLARTAVPRTITLRTELADGLPAIRGDSAQIQQVVLNLLTNAAAAVAPTAGTVVVRTGTEELTPARLARTWVRDDAAPGAYVYVEVEDDGVGMAPETLARIFDPFFTTRAEGRGLGLTAVLGAVRAHHGVIDLESTPGRGSRFRVLLPVGDAEPSAPRPPRAAEDWTSSGTVLVADDEVEVRAAIVVALERRGLRVLVAADGDDAVTLAAAHCTELDLVILDRAMPGRPGDEAAHAIRAIAPRARIVLCSGAHEGGRVDVADALLQKPFRREELTDTVRRLLG